MESPVTDQAPLELALASAVQIYAAVKALLGQPYAAHFQELIVALAAEDISEALRIHRSGSFNVSEGCGCSKAEATFMEQQYGELCQLIGVSVADALPPLCESRPHATDGH